MMHGNNGVARPPFCTVVLIIVSIESASLVRYKNWSRVKKDMPSMRHTFSQKYYMWPWIPSLLVTEVARSIAS